MGKVLAGITISVDGFITGPGDLPHEGWGRLVFPRPAPLLAATSPTMAWSTRTAG
jgi:hypothetical protein